MASPPPLDSTDPNIRRSHQTVQSQSKPVYPSYHLEVTFPISNKPRPSDYYRSLNILRSSPRSPQIRLPVSTKQTDQTHHSNMNVRQAHGVEEFIAVVFGNEVWMGLVDFKSDKPTEEAVMEEEFVRDLKRSSAVIFPRTFRTPTMSLPPRVIEPVYEDESEYERKVEFDIHRNSSNDGLGKEKQSRESLPAHGPKVRKEHLRDREGRKGQPPPSSVLVGYKYASQHPKSILKRTETYPSPLLPSTVPAELSFVRQARQPSARQKGDSVSILLTAVISDGELWSRQWDDQSIVRSKHVSSPLNPTVSERPSTPPQNKPTKLTTVLESPTRSSLSPISLPFIPSKVRNVASLPHLLTPPAHRTAISAYGAERILGRLTPDSAVSRTISALSEVGAEDSDDEYDNEDWSTTISSPVTLYTNAKFLAAHLRMVKICLRTEIYSPHPAGPPPSCPAQAYSRTILIDTLDSPSLRDNRISWSVPSKREFDNRLYYPSSLSLCTQDGVVEIADDFTYLGDGRFWCGGFIVVFSSRRTVTGDIDKVKTSLRKECAWLIGIEADVGQMERWMSGAVPVREGSDGNVGQLRDEAGRGMKRELPPEMFI